MPRPCAVEAHARGYKVSSVCGCHGLAPWRLTLAATTKGQQRLRMPRPCAVEAHARGYNERSAAFEDATALRRGGSRLLLKLRHYSPKASSVKLHGARPWHLGEWRSFFCSRARESPRRKAVASGSGAAFFLAAHVSLHGARPWHLGEWRSFFCSRARESPRRKAVASGRVAQLFL